MFFRRSTCFEATDRRIAVIGGEAAVSKAEFLRGYSKAVSLIWSSDAKPPATEEFAKTGISLVPHPAGLEICKQKICVVTPEGRESFDILYPALGCTVESDLARKLGAAVTDVGCLKVDEHQRTTIEGLYAAGDVVSDLHQIAVATGHAAIAATHIP